MWHGILVINKGRGLTSHQVIARLRRILNQKEAGHTGTLDPEATGVLVVGLGEATRALFFLDDLIKVYRAEIVLGQVTDTQDASGAVMTETKDFHLGAADLAAAIRQLTGEITQIPPMFSAVKVNGRKLYDIAREGREIARDARKITVWRWDVLSPQTVYGYKSVVISEITCSRGTYIRTLIHDLGQLLGCGARMGGLTRLQSGGFKLEDAYTIEQVQDYYVQGRFGELLVSVNTALHHLYPVWLADEDLAKVSHGGKISFEKYPGDLPSGGLARALDRFSNLVAILKLEDTGAYRFWQPVKVFKY